MKSTIWAILGTKGEHGIITTGLTIDTQLPLITTDETFVPAFTQIAKDIAHQLDEEIVVARFVLDVVLTRFNEPKGHASNAGATE